VAWLHRIRNVIVSFGLQAMLDGDALSGEALSSEETDPDSEKSPATEESFTILCLLLVLLL